MRKLFAVLLVLFFCSVIGAEETSLPSNEPMAEYICELFAPGTGDTLEWMFLCNEATGTTLESEYPDVDDSLDGTNIGDVAESTVIPESGEADDGGIELDDDGFLETDTSATTALTPADDFTVGFWWKAYENFANLNSSYGIDLTRVYDDVPDEAGGSGATDITDTPSLWRRGDWFVYKKQIPMWGKGRQVTGEVLFLGNIGQLGNDEQYGTSDDNFTDASAIEQSIKKFTLDMQAGCGTIGQAAVEFTNFDLTEPHFFVYTWDASEDLATIWVDGGADQDGLDDTNDMTRDFGSTTGRPFFFGGYDSNADGSGCNGDSSADPVTNEAQAFDNIFLLSADIMMEEEIEEAYRLGMEGYEFIRGDTNNKGLSLLETING